MKTQTGLEQGTPARRPTIHDVAQLAGVSHQTVSRYLRYSGGLKPATEARIDAAIRELDYRPNLIARSMRTRRTGRLAVLMPAMAFSPARMLAGATAAAHAAGYTLDIVSPEGGAEGRTERMLELADSGQVEGILTFAPVVASGLARVPAEVAVVEAAEFDDEMRGVGELTDAAPVVEFIEQLAAWGHRRFYHVAGSPQFASARARRAVYLETIDRLGLESVGVYDGDFSGESGIEAIRALTADQAPTAVIAASDIVAAGVIRGAVERGWSVPRDVSVTGWDNQTLGQFLPPTLTTVDVNLELVGHNAMARLIAAVRHEEPHITATPLNRTIWRESTAAPREIG